MPFEDSLCSLRAILNYVIFILEQVEIIYEYDEVLP